MAKYYPEGFVRLEQNGTNAINFYYYWTFNDQFASPYRLLKITNITTGSVIYNSSASNGLSGSSGGTNGSNAVVITGLQPGHTFFAELTVRAYYYLPGEQFELYDSDYGGTASLAPTWIETAFSAFRAGTNVQTSGRDSTIGAELTNTYTITNGSLPTGVSFSKVNLPVYPGNYIQFSGTPTVPGQTYNVTFTANGDGGTADLTLVGTVQPSKYGTVCVWSGTAWVEDQVKIRNSGNSSWDLATVYVRNSAGNAWVKTKPKDAVNY